MSWTPVVQNLLGTGFLSRLLAQYTENKTIILNRLKLILQCIIVKTRFDSGLVFRKFYDFLQLIYFYIDEIYKNP